MRWRSVRRTIWDTWRPSVHLFLSPDEESDQLGASGGDPTVYWGIQLDQDLIETLTAIYPEWFKDYNNLKNNGKGAINLSPNAMADGSALPGVFGPSKSQSKAEVDETPIQKTMDKHKESLKVKLLLRRPINQLVDQGIMPPLKTPPGFHEQRQKLERAKMGDILKSKIQRRPDRQELIQQHILEDSNVDPSLQDKQRQLKKARLADDLNERLAHRPGPLELIKGNILKADELFAQAIKDGQIPFKRTCEGESRKHAPSPFVFEEDSSSEGAMSPLQEMDQTQTACNNNNHSPPDINIPVPSPSLGSVVSSLSPLSSVASPASVSMSPANLCTFISTPAAPSSLLTVSPSVSVVSPVSKVVSTSSNSTSSLSSSSCTGRSSSESGKETSRSRKKSKSKSAPKTRTIKFHEYKGPPSAQKNYQTNSPEGETSYELLLQQQQLFLQWQLELQHKFPQIILPAAQKTNADGSVTNLSGNLGSVQGVTSSTLSQDIQPTRCLTKLEDMKVSDLKLELKKRNLTVSGSKPQLIERLRPYSEMATVVISTNNSPPSSNNGMINGETSCPSLLALDSSSQGSPAENHNSVKHQDDHSRSPSSEHMLDHDSLEASLSETVNGDMTYAVTSPYSINSVGAATPLHRPPSVAPMDVEGGTNSEFDHMDISDIARNLPQTSSSSNTQIPSLPLPLSLTASSLPLLSELNNSFNSHVYSEDALRKKIEELQRELQRSQMQLHQQQSMLQRQQNLQQSPRRTPSPSPNSHTQTVQTAAIPSGSISEMKSSNNNNNSSQMASDQKLQQQKLLLQQHIHQKLQNQQQHQQQTVNNNPSPGSVNVKASLAAFLQGQSSVATTVANSTNSPKIYFRMETNPSLNETNSGLCNISTDSTDENDSLVNSNKQRANSLPNGLGHIRTNSLPNFVGLSTIPQKQPISRTTTDPQFLFSKPPPDYDEATKQLKQFTQTLIETLNRPVRGRKSVKSQDVEDVLEILIKNGELPPSAAQEPPTPPTPKGMQGPLLFSANNASNTVNSNALQVPSTSINQLRRNDSGVVGNSSQQQTQLPADGMVVMEDVSSSSPNPSTPPTFDLDLNLDLDALEPMHLEGFHMDTHMKDSSDYLGTTIDNHEDINVSSVVGDFGMFSDDAMHIDIDMTDVSDWLDEILPNPVLSNNNNISLNNNLGNDPLSNHLNVLLPSSNSNIHHVDCNDPLLSANQDIFHLLNLEDDFKTTSDLGVLAWDKVDFAT